MVNTLEKNVPSKTNQKRKKALIKEWNQAMIHDYEEDCQKIQIVSLKELLEVNAKSNKK